MTMPRRPLFQRCLTAVLCVTAAVVLMAVAVPHHHDGASAAHPTKTCRACKIQDGFSAAPPAAQPVTVRPALLHIAHVSAADAFRAGVLIVPLAPRAPPVLS